MKIIIKDKKGKVINISESKTSKIVKDLKSTEKEKIYILKKLSKKLKENKTSGKQEIRILNTYQEIESLIHECWSEETPISPTGYLIGIYLGVYYINKIKKKANNNDLEKLFDDWGSFLLGQNGMAFCHWQWESLDLKCISWGIEVTAINNAQETNKQINDMKKDIIEYKTYISDTEPQPVLKGEFITWLEELKLEGSASNGSGKFIK